ncbi:MAG TPA: universal stress protein [Polyangia bacterium]|jgi:nucleotide-binding universal stress UspA family protein
MIQIRHILVPTDFSDGSLQAFETALEMARDSGARLTLFHVHHVPASVFPDVILPIAPEMMRNVEHSVDIILERWCERARAAGVVADRRTTFGATHEEICAAAEELGVDLIVIGTHGRGGISHVLLGSVAEKVVRKAPCPVLTVRAHMHSTFAHT